jgi:hypothetical protein
MGRLPVSSCVLLYHCSQRQTFRLSGIAGGGHSGQFDVVVSRSRATGNFRSDALFAPFKQEVCHRLSGRAEISAINWSGIS